MVTNEIIMYNCSICNINIENEKSQIILNCQHKFHSECINTWTQSNNICPICQTKIKYYINNAETNNDYINNENYISIKVNILSNNDDINTNSLESNYIMIENIHIQMPPPIPIRTDIISVNRQYNFECCNPFTCFINFILTFYRFFEYIFRRCILSCSSFLSSCYILNCISKWISDCTCVCYCPCQCPCCDYHYHY